MVPAALRYGTGAISSRAMYSAPHGNGDAAPINPTLTPEIHGQWRNKSPPRFWTRHKMRA